MITSKSATNQDYNNQDPHTDGLEDEEMENSHENVKKIIGDVFTEKDLHYIVAQTAQVEYQIVDYYLRPASEGLEGFLADHIRMTVNIKENGYTRNIHLFIKTLPMMNKPKVDFITQNLFYERETLMFKLFEEMDETNNLLPCHTKAFIHNNKIFVMPDLSVQGYKTHPVQNYFDKIHVFTAVSSVARFHAKFTNYVSEKCNINEKYNFMDVYGHIMIEPNFCDSSWLRTSAKLINNFLKEFSPKSQQYSNNMEKKLEILFIKGCESVKEHRDTVNVIIHKDLWANNIMFQYTGDEVTNAILVDFQCIRYAPPAFDLMLFLYLTTSKSFRKRHETEILHYYYSTFYENLDDIAKIRLQDLNYDRDAHLAWCDKARLFGMVLAIAIFPFILMDPKAAQEIFDDPDTYFEYMEVDRSRPVLKRARENLQYRNRQLEICEEFVEKYIAGDTL